MSRETKITQPPDQKARDRALDPRQSFIVQAPAGSGKTDLLIKRYLRLLAGVEYPEQILAITFTRKAAAEMRARIVHALQQADATGALGSTASPHEIQLYELAQAVRRQDAARDWQLASYPARLKIQTIDSFNSELTRQMPLLAKFGGQPGITEHQQTLYEEAALRTLQMLEDKDAGVAGQMAVLLSHLDNNWSRLQGLLVSMLGRRDQWLMQIGGSTARLDRQALEQALDREVNHQLALLRPLVPIALHTEIIALAAYAARRLNEARLSGEQKKGEPIESPIMACMDLLQLPSADAETLPVWSGMTELLLTLKGDWRKTVNKNQGFPPDGRDEKKRMEHLLLQLREAETDIIKECCHRLHRVRLLPTPAYTDQQWNVLEALVAILPLAVAQLQLVFAEAGEVDFTEIALRAREALGGMSDEQAPTDLALRLDNRIAHILIDEFQDTSLGQYQLLQALVDGWQPQDGRTLFVVGDPMQSIYRFREAEVGLYLDARSHGIGGVQLEPVTLSANFRSRPALVNWVNNAFSEILPASEDPASGAVPYSPAAAQREAPDSQDTPGTGVKVHPLFTADKDVEAEALVDVLLQTQAANPQAKIAILFQSRTHLASILPCLQAHNVPYQAVEIEKLGQQSVVQDLLALTRAVLHPADRTAWLAVLRAPWCGLTVADLQSLATIDTQACIPAMLEDTACVRKLSQSGQTRLEKIWPVLSDALHNRRRRHLRDAIENLWLALDGPATLHIQVDMDDALVFFNVLENHDQGADIADPIELEHYLQQIFAPPDPKADDRLQILTIHKAKGLEFDVVLAPGLGRKPRNESERLLLWQERPRAYGKADLLLAPLSPQGGERDPVYKFLQQLETERAQLEKGRLLYVLATRAREALHLFGHVTAKEDTEGALQFSLPTKGSALSELWPIIEPAWEEALRTYEPDAQTADADETAYTYEGPWRLPADWQRPALPKAIVNEQDADLLTVSDSGIDLPESSLPESSLPEFSWASEAARVTGTLVHRVLQQMADTKVANWSTTHIERLRPFFEQWLKQEGIPKAERHSAITRANNILNKVISSPTARWLLFTQHTEAKSEYALNYWVDNTVKTAVLDRTFIDEKGTRWIVDYKTGGHEGGNVEAFLASERERYTPQLARYAKLMQTRESDRPIRVALYYPLLDQFIDWAPEL